MIVPSSPSYLSDLTQYVEDKLEDPTAIIAALAALLGDPEAYGLLKGRPFHAFTDFVHELLLRDRTLGEFVQDQGTPISRTLIKGKWCADWRGLRKLSVKELPTPPGFDVCISFAGEDREVAGRIANLIKSNGMMRRVFYDDFEKVALWGEELARYLHGIYSQRSKFCVILFSHAYSRKVWTRTEYRAALTRIAQEQDSYVLPVAIDVSAVPDQFENVAYWQFKPGDEKKIAKAVERKINEYMGQHYLSAEEMADIVSIETTTSAILDGFRAGIQEKRTAKDIVGAQILTVLALISAADVEHIDPSVRALIDLVLFAPGPVSDSFEDDVVSVIGTASAQRHLGVQGPFLFNASGWGEYLHPYRYAGEPEPEDQEPGSDDGD
jgi:hypothetical protein